MRVRDIFDRAAAIDFIAAHCAKTGEKAEYRASSRLAGSELELVEIGEGEGIELAIIGGKRLGISPKDFAAILSGAE